MNTAPSRRTKKPRACDIYDEIDSLARASNMIELTSMLIPILNKLAYGTVAGSDSALRTHEAWKNTWTHRMENEKK